MIAEKLAERVLRACRARGLRLAAVESCTGGLIAAALTDISGSSDVMEGGFITYSNAAKMRMVGVSEALLAKHGAVSAEAARAMAEGGVKASGADIAVAVTGIAGPSGSTAQKPVGLVHIAVAMRGAESLHYEARFGDLGRKNVRLATVHKALELVLTMLKGRIS